MGDGWGGARGLEQWLFDEPYAFDFFQAVRLLELRAERLAGADDAEEPPVLFRASFELSFPPSAIRGLTRVRPGAPPEMTVALLGTGGLDGPLPTSFTEEILERLFRDDRAPAAFLDIFHNRLLALLYRIRKVHRPGLATVRPERTATARHLFSLAGVGLDPLAEQYPHPETLLRYCGLLAGRQRSAAGLAALLSDYFQVPVRVRQFVGAFAGIEPDQCTTIGTPGFNNALGRTATIGTRAWIQDAGIELRIGPLSASQFEGFLPGGRAHGAVHDLTRLYAGSLLQVSLQLVLEASEAERLTTSKLGWTARLAAPFHADDDDQVRLRLRKPDSDGRGNA
jgi:type VI secretion system protein ImpH